MSNARGPLVLDDELSQAIDRALRPILERRLRAIEQEARS